MSRKPLARRLRHLNFLIAPREQLKHVAFVFLAVTVSVGLICLYVLAELKATAPILAECVQGIDVITRLQTSILLIFIFGVLGLGLFYGVLSIIFTHKVFGSLHSMETYVESILKGDLSARLAPLENNQAKRLMTLVAKLGHKVKQMERK